MSTVLHCPHYMGMDEIAVSHFENMRGSQHDEQPQIEQMSNSLFAYMAVDKFHTLRKERGVLGLSRRKMLGGMYVRKAIDLFTKKRLEWATNA